MVVKIKRLPNSKELGVPLYQTTGAAGQDVYAAIENLISLAPGERALIPLGFALELPIGCEAQIRPRSGVSFKKGLVAVFGTVDSDYRGEIKALIHNVSAETVSILRGDRIAQIVFASYIHVEYQEVSELFSTSRGENGFGSTGFNG